MAVHNVLKNGIAPSNAQIGDIVRTAGGNFRIVPSNTPGARFNPASGRWSVKDSTPEYISSAAGIVNNNNAAMSDAADVANAISARSSAQSYAFNAAEAQKSRDWQEYLSNTAHQREVYDLIAAGLNPVLSASLGGSSTPSGATASGSSFTGQKAEVDSNMLQFLAGVTQTQMNNDTQRDIARIQADTSLQQAKISSAASMYSANASAAASRYGSDAAYRSALYSADKNYNSSVYGIDKNYNAQIYSSDNSAKSGDFKNRIINNTMQWYRNYVNRTAGPDMQFGW